LEFAASTHHPFSASLGDLIAVAALAFAWLTFRRDRLLSIRSEVRAATALLAGLNERFFAEVGPLYFSTVYTPAVALERARSRLGQMDQVFSLPPEPVATLIADQRAVANGLVSVDTMINATIALWQINKINELVRKQAMFNAVHAPDFVDDSITEARKEAVTTASVMISAEVHHDGIGDAQSGWYKRLEDSVDQDLQALAHRGRFWNVVRRNPAELVGDLSAIGALLAVAAAYANSL